MYVRVAPLLRLPRSIGAFDYRNDTTTLVPGSLVVVPFRKKNVSGIVTTVLKTSAVPHERILPVTGVISAETVLPKPQFETAERIAADTFSSTATMFRGIIPFFPLKSSLELPAVISGTTDAATVQFLNEETGAPDGTVVAYRTRSSLHELYRRISQRLSHAGRSTLIITPTIAHAEGIAGSIDGSVLYHHSMTTQELRRSFVSIRSVRSAIVVGTRSALFAPLVGIGAIIVDDEDADGHQQEEPNPRYDGRRVAAILAKESSAKLIFTSRMPTLALTQRYPVTRTLDPAEGPHTTFIDLDQQRATGDYAIVTEPTLLLLRDVTARGGRALVVHQRRSEFGSLECRDCGFVPSCEQCGTPLKQDGMMLVCRHCAATVPIPAKCPRCNGVSLRGRGRGIAPVIQELERSGLHAAALQITDAPAKPGTIDVATAAQASDMPEAAYGLVLMTRYESLLAVPRFDADERARRMLVTFASCVAPGGSLVVQGAPTHRHEIESPDDPAWRKTELGLRDRFGYPPAWKVIMLRQRQARMPGRSVPADTVYKKLSQFTSIVVTPPQRSRGRSRQNPAGIMLIIRTKKELAPEIKHLLSTLDESWTITINPAEIA